MKCNTVHTKLAGYLDDAVTGRRSRRMSAVHIREHLAKPANYCREERAALSQGLTSCYSRVAQEFAAALGPMRISRSRAPSLPNARSFAERVRRMRDRRRNSTRPIFISPRLHRSEATVSAGFFRHVVVRI